MSLCHVFGGNECVFGWSFGSVSRFHAVSLRVAMYPTMKAKIASIQRIISWLKGPLVPKRDLLPKRQHMVPVQLNCELNPFVETHISCRDLS